MIRKINKVIVVALYGLLVACSESYTPKPSGYPRIYYPKHEYTLFSNETCPYAFQIPVYAEMVKDDNYTHEPCWYNLYFKPFDATLHLSYKEFSGLDSYDSLYEDTRRLAYKHTIKADDIVEEMIENTLTGTTGVVYYLKGNTATNLNFFLSDSTKHFFRGALYFNSKTTPDSIAPVFDFILEDVNKIMETFEWK